MKRILMVLAVALLMAAMVVATSAPAFAASCKKSLPSDNWSCSHGGGKPQPTNPGGHLVPGKQV
jgi:hypothetical protein